MISLTAFAWHHEDFFGCLSNMLSKFKKASFPHNWIYTTETRVIESFNLEQHRERNWLIRKIKLCNMTRRKSCWLYFPVLSICRFGKINGFCTTNFQQFPYTIQFIMLHGAHFHQSIINYRRSHKHFLISFHQIQTEYINGYNWI